MSDTSGADNRATIGDIEVAWTEAGPVDGRPVVLVHGLAEARGTWTVQQAELDDVHTYAYDLRGHGQTTVGDAEASLEQLGRDLIGFLEAVSGPAVVVGFSLGGTVALWAAAERPDLVSRAVVLGTSSVGGRAAARFYGSRIAAGGFPQERAAARLLVPHPLPRANTAAASCAAWMGLTARRWLCVR